MKLSSLFLQALAILLIGAVSSYGPRQTAFAATAPVPRIEVHAPYAQQLIEKIKSEHPEIQKLGLHAVPPGQTESAIIASNFPEKIGKLSSPSDLQTVA